MAIEFKKETALFRDVVSVEEAEALLEWLQKHSKGKLDFSSCSHLHTAILQVLMAAMPVGRWAAQVVAQSNRIVWPEDAGLRLWLQAALQLTAKPTAATD